MKRIEIDIRTLFEFTGKPIPENLPDPEDLKPMVEEQFSFLPQPIQIEFEQWKGIITFPEV